MRALLRKASYEAAFDKDSAITRGVGPMSYGHSHRTARRTVEPCNCCKIYIDVSVSVQHECRMLLRLGESQAHRPPSAERLLFDHVFEWHPAIAVPKSLENCSSQ